MTQQTLELPGPGVAEVLDMERRSNIPARTEPPAAPSIETTLALAVEKGIDPASLEKLVALYERVADRRAAQAYAAALAAFKAEVGPILKNRDAKDGGKSVMYRYADLEEITKVCDPILLRHGLAYTFDSQLLEGLTIVKCTVRHVEGHKESANFTCKASGTRLMNDAQQSASAVTFGRRYSLVLALGLTIDNDDDGRRAVANPAPEHDADAPKVRPRAERQQPPDNGDPRVTAADLGNLLREWKNATKQPKATAEDLAKWARGILQAPDTLDLTRVSAWTIDGFEACWQALAEGR